jgi:hypothetical protein
MIMKSFLTTVFVLDAVSTVIINAKEFFSLFC